jgi:hypothetical protein
VKCPSYEPLHYDIFPILMLFLFSQVQIFSAPCSQTPSYITTFNNVFLYILILTYEGVSKSFWTDRLGRELQMAQLSAIRCSGIAILWVSLVSFAAITICIASRTSVYCFKRIFLYRLSPESFGYPPDRRKDKRFRTETHQAFCKSNLLVMSLGLWHWLVYVVPMYFNLSHFTIIYCRRLSLCYFSVFYSHGGTWIWTRCGYDVPGIILFQVSYLSTYSLLRGVTFTVLPSAAMHLAQRCCHW